MSISFNRNGSQVLFESFIDVDSNNLYEKRDDFKNHYLTSDEAEQLKVALKKDSLDFFYNGILSFAEGIDAAFQKKVFMGNDRIILFVVLFNQIFYGIKRNSNT